MGGRDAYAAIADPTRRRILELLHADGALPAGVISRRFATASRPAISRHLRILRESGLVNCRRDGKAQIYTLNPRPLAGIRDGWLARFGTVQSERLKALRRAAERKRP